MWSMGICNGYNTKANSVGGSNNITEIYIDFFTDSIWNKYYDTYSSSGFEQFIIEF